MLPRLLLPLLLCSLLACARSQSLPPQNDPPPEPCPFVYVYAPGNYIVDIAGGDQVILDPGVQEFELFCSPGEARAAVTEAVRQGAAPEGDWRIYRLAGDMEDLAQPLPQRRYVLRRMAQIVDWVTEI